MYNLHVPFLDLRVGIEERATLNKAINRVFNHGKLVMGPEVEFLESLLSSYCNRKYCTAVGSGTTALILALRALDLSSNDEVITTSLSWIATANAIAFSGATPVFADVNDDLNISPDSVSRLISARTKAIVSVDYTGRMADFARLEQICSENNLVLISDASQAFGAKRGNRVSGSYGKMAAISHNPMKVLAALGEAGSILTDDEELKLRIDRLRYNGTENKEYLIEPSFNGRIDTIQAAVLIERLKIFPSLQEARQMNAKFYESELGVLDQVDVPQVYADECHSFYTYTILAKDRDLLKDYLNEMGVETKIQHPLLMNRQKPYQSCKSECLNADLLLKKVLCIPIHEKLSKACIEHVAFSIKQFYSR